MPDEERRFGRYLVVGNLGAGGMGEVFAAVDDVLGREVAIKTLRGRGDGLGARLLDERFRHEARAIAQLAHPNVVQVFDVDVAASPPYLVMERVAGPSLKARLASGPLSDHDARALGVQMAQALAAAHARGIVHRDVKPANILAAGAGMWKLADFGVAHVPDSSLTLTGQFVGSPAYSAPEALTKGELGPTGDIYALGAVLYEAVTGRWPRAEQSAAGVAALLAPTPPLRSLAPHCPPAMAEAIDRALDLDVHRRPTATDLARALASDVAPSLDTLPVAPLAYHAVAARMPAAVVVPSPWLAWQRRAPWIIAGAAIVVAVIVIATSGDDGPPSPSSRFGGAASSMSPIAPVSRDPMQIDVTPPMHVDGKGAKDWNKVVHKIEEGDIDEALDKLDEFERKHGASAETERLRDQLVQLPRVERGRGRGRHPRDD